MGDSCIQRSYKYAQCMKKPSQFHLKMYRGKLCFSCLKEQLNVRQHKNRKKICKIHLEVIFQSCLGYLSILVVFYYKVDNINQQTNEIFSYQRQLRTHVLFVLALFISKWYTICIDRIITDKLMPHLY